MPKASVRALKPRCTYSLIWTKRKVRPRIQVRTRPSFIACFVAPADALERVMDREAGGDQDRRVHPRDGDRQFERVRRPGARVDDHAEEEVRGEERPEQHHLGDDEKQDPEGLSVDPRALVRLRRTMVVVLGGVAAGSVREAVRTRSPSVLTSLCHDRGEGRGRAAGLDVADRLVGDLADPADQVALQPARLLAGEGGDQDLVDLVVLDRVADRLEGVVARRSAGRSRRRRRGRARRGSRRGRGRPAPRRRPRCAGR